MNIDTTAPTPREQASLLINDYARLKATVEAATADTRAQIAALTAALNQAAAPYLMQLEQIELQAKTLALAHRPEIFGEDRSSLTENGFTLAVRPTEAVTCEDEENALHALMVASVKGRNTAERLAASACVRLNPQLNKTYILEQYDRAPDWFAHYGIAVVDKVSASLKPAPKPRAAKAKAKLKTADAPVESEAA